MGSYNPVKIIQGIGVRRKIIDECADKRALIFCTESAYKRYKRDHLLHELFSSPHVLFEHTFGSNPSIKDLAEVSKKYSRCDSIDMIIGLGGGSAMDAAKIASVSIPAQRNDFEISDLLVNRELFSEFNTIDCIQVPTTAGTGSEVTPFATVWDYDNQKKKSLSNPAMFAKKAFVDPDFLIDIPSDIALSTGLDALNQSFESIWNKNSTPTTLDYAIRGAQLSLANLPFLNKINNDEKVRKELAEASLCAGLAISHTRTSICHSISYTLTLKFGIPHGLACAFSMPEVFNFNVGSIKSEIRAIELHLDFPSKYVLDEIIKQYKLEEIYKGYIGSKQMVLDAANDMFTKGRFDNNIRECSPSELQTILIKSCENFGIH